MNKAITNQVEDMEQNVENQMTPAPIPPPNPTEVRLAELNAKLADDTITDSELKEMLRLERGL